MKKILINILLIIFAVFVLSACSNGDMVSNLTLRGYTSTFYVGDTFNTDGLLVTATTNDGTINVSDDVEIDSSAVDMTKAGTYCVIVKYANLERAYYITVNEVENNQRLSALEVDTTKAKLEYVIGETFDSTGLALIATYVNSNGTPDEVKYLTDLDGFTLDIRDIENNVIDRNSTLTTMGTYTVHITYGDNSDPRTSYEFSVTSGVHNINEAINEAISNKEHVGRGTSVNSYSRNSNYYGNLNTQYAYNDNLVSLTYRYNSTSYTENYFVNNSGNTIGVRGTSTTNYEKLDYVNADYLNGMEYVVGDLKYYGAEGLLGGLYDKALEDNNCDYSENITKSSDNYGTINTSYSFSFGYLEVNNNTYYLHQISVTFRLDNNTNALVSLHVNDDVYTSSNFSFYLKSDNTVVTDITNYELKDLVARVNTLANKDTSLSGSYNINQTISRRTATNIYSNVE